MIKLTGEYQEAGLKETAQAITAMPCPFCGGEPLAKISRGGYGLVLFIGIVCADCKCGTQRMATGTMVNGKTYTASDRLLAAAAIWNRRTEPAKMEPEPAPEHEPKERTGTQTGKMGTRSHRNTNDAAQRHHDIITGASADATGGLYVRE